MFNARPFFAGLLLGLTALSVAGATLRPSHFVDNFNRIHAGLNFRNFFATARELEAIVAAVPDDKVVVIVGGTSVFQGASQAENYVWTRYLQQALGDRYKVIDFAQRGGRPNDSGNAAAEMLLQRNRKVIYVCDAMVDEFTIRLEGSFYKQVIFDAWQRGYLIPWAPRDESMRAALWSRQPALREAAWGALIDLPLNFKDLWNYVSYEIAGSVWNPVSVTASFDALKTLSDPEPSPEWYRARGYPKNTDAQDMKIVDQQISPLHSPDWNDIKAAAEEQFPPQLRAVSIVNVDLDSPFYLDRVPESQQKFELLAHHMGDLLQGIGFSDTLVAEQGFTAADYSDRIHLNVEGGMKLASIVAPHVQATAEARGYVK